METYNRWDHLVLGIVAGLPAVIVALATLWSVIKGNLITKDVQKRVNGPVDELVRQNRVMLALLKDKLQGKTPPGPDERCPIDPPARQ